MDALRNIVFNFGWKPLLKLYLRRDSSLRMDHFRLKVLKGVFHPGFFFSTKYLYSFLKQKKLEGLRFLEIGCGSGILSLLARSKGALVTALDIDEKAVRNTQLNFGNNLPADQQKAIVLQSDLFSALPQQQFDVIVINPPYFFKNVSEEDQYAWYCGENGEYFERLFASLPLYMHPNTEVFMILADNCEIERIKTIAERHRIYFDVAGRKKIQWEENTIFKLRATT